MKVLILRTIAHTNVWEGIKDYCVFDMGRFDQTKMIYCWEPHFAFFEISDFSYALGIYTAKYFNYKIENQKVFKESCNEQIISVLKLKLYPRSSKFFRIDEKNKCLYIYYEFTQKLWDNPNQDLMNKIDQILIEAKQIELKIKYGKVPATNFPPLLFSLELNVVNKILEQNKIQNEFNFN